MKHNVPVQSLIDHIKTAIDVDTWAKEMVEELLKEQQQQIWEFQDQVEYLTDKQKEQETKDTGKRRIFECERCGYGIDDIFLSEEEKYPIDPIYCPNCGRVVKRE